MSNSKQTYRRPEVFYQLAGLQKQKLKYRAGAPGSQNGNSSVYHLCTGQNSVTTRPRADAYRNLRQTVTALITRRRFGIANQIISTISAAKRIPVAASKAYWLIRSAGTSPVCGPEEDLRCIRPRGVLYMRRPCNSPA